MTADELEKRLKDYALRSIRVAASLKHDMVSQLLGRQFLKASTSSGANYREAQRGTSRADFLAKVKIAERECDESCYWLELMIAAGILEERLVADLLKEGKELTAILGAIAVSTKRSTVS